MTAASEAGQMSAPDYVLSIPKIPLTLQGASTDATTCMACRGRTGGAGFPLRLVSAVALEHLDPVVFAVGDIDPAVGVAADVVNDVELALAGSGLALRHQQFAMG
jgi:hypothetical protein